MKRRIVLLGPPASGKGTQAEMIQARYDIPVTSPGAMLREEKRAGSVFGIEAATLTSKGWLLADEIGNAVVEKWLYRQHDGFVLDGYPRSEGQADALDEMLAKRSEPLEVVIFLEADETTIRDRVARRRMCSECGLIVSVGWQIRRVEDGCPACKGALVKRNDDLAETLEARLREYASKTQPLIARYARRGVLESVNAAATPEVVFGCISKILEAA